MYAWVPLGSAAAAGALNASSCVAVIVTSDDDVTVMYANPVIPGAPMSRGRLPRSCSAGAGAGASRNVMLTVPLPLAAAGNRMLAEMPPPMLAAAIGAKVAVAAAEPTVTAAVVDDGRLGVAVGAGTTRAGGGDDVPPPHAAASAASSRPGSQRRTRRRMPESSRAKGCTDRTAACAGAAWGVSLPPGGRRDLRARRPSASDRRPAREERVHVHLRRVPARDRRRSRDRGLHREARLGENDGRPDGARVPLGHRGAARREDPVHPAKLRSDVVRRQSRRLHRRDPRSGRRVRDAPRAGGARRALRRAAEKRAVGGWAMFADSEGNIIGLHSPAPESSG